jgi:Mn2+/Fe2+ NRAMP family transporter
LLVVRGSYRRVEKVFLAACAVYVTYMAAAFLARPPWETALAQMVRPQIGGGTYVRDAIALIGTTIAPWMQFYVQSSVRDKGLTVEHYPYERIDVLLGSTLSNVISFFIVVACAATLFANNIPIQTAADAARALAPIVGGEWPRILFAVGLFNASAVGAVVVPLSTAYAVTEAIGSESGLGRRIREAPLFIGIFSALLLVATLVVMLPGINLVRLILVAQVLNGLLLPVILFLMLRIAGNRRLMGPFVNGPLFNLIAWATVALVIALSAVSVATQLAG